MDNLTEFTSSEGTVLEKRDAFIPEPGEGLDDRLYDNFEIAGEYNVGAQNDHDRLWSVVFPDDEENVHVVSGECVFFNWPYILEL